MCVVSTTYTQLSCVCWCLQNESSVESLRRFAWRGQRHRQLYVSQIEEQARGMERDVRRNDRILAKRKVCVD